MINVKKNKIRQYFEFIADYGGMTARQYRKRVFPIAYSSLAFFALLWVQLPSFAQKPHGRDSVIEQIVQDTVIFRFAPGEKLFREDYKKNKTAIFLLRQSIQEHRQGIKTGEIKVRVRGFCGSFGSSRINLQSAKNRSNQVKSYFITHEELKEDNFQTTNSVYSWNNMSDLVVISYLFREKQNEIVPLPPLPEDTTLITKIIADTIAPESTSQVYSKADTTKHQTPESMLTVSHEEESLYRWAIKTNIAYLAATVANIGAERVLDEHYSVDFSFIYSPYTVARNYRLRFLVIQPEFRYWPDSPMKGHFFGFHLNIGAFNISVDKENRYQSPDGFYGAGVSYGYTLPFARRWAVEFTIGAGYIHTKYDTYYNIPNGSRYKKNTPYNYWGLTKAGINMVYKFGK